MDPIFRAYVTGYTTSPDYPVQNAYQPTLNGSLDAFVSVIDTFAPVPDQLYYSTYFGGSNFEAARSSDLSLDPYGQIHITGDTWSGNLPLQIPLPGGTSLKPDIDAFVAKFDPSLSGPPSLGGFGNDFGEGIAACPDGFVAKIVSIPGVNVESAVHRLDLTIQPNPGSSQARIRFTLPQAEDTRLEILDVNGRRLTTLVEGRLPPGDHERRWDGRIDGGSRAAPGVYFVRMRVAGGSRTRALAWLN